MSNAGTRALTTVQALDFERVAGGPQDIKIVEYLTKQLRNMGIEPQLQWFPMPRYHVIRALISITESDDREISFPATGYGYSGSTPPGGVTAPFLYVENGDDMLLDRAEGCIVLLNTPPSRKMYRKLIEAGVVGFVTISGNIFDSPETTDLAQHVLRAGCQDTPTLPILPGLCIRAADAAQILNAAPKHCRIELEQETFEGRCANIIADIPGIVPEAEHETIVFSAHYDSVPFSHGSYDNASGCAILLELCRRFLRQPLRRPCRFIWCGAEEMGLVGSIYYVRSLSAKERRRLVFTINVDLAGQLIGENYAVVCAGEDVCSLLHFLASYTGMALNVRQGIFPSDAASFSDVGIPSVCLYRTGVGGHSRYDTAQWIHSDALQKTYDIAASLACALGDSVVFPVECIIPTDVQYKLNEYFDQIN